MNQPYDVPPPPEDIEQSADYNLQQNVESLYHQAKEKLQTIHSILTSPNFQNPEKVNKVMQLFKNDFFISKEKSADKIKEQTQVLIYEQQLKEKVSLIQNLKIQVQQYKRKSQLLQYEKAQQIQTLKLQVQKLKEKSQLLQDEKNQFNIDISNSEEIERTNKINKQAQIQFKKAELEEFYKVERQLLKTQNSEKEKKIQALLKAQQQKETIHLNQIITKENRFNALAIQKQELEDAQISNNIQIANLNQTINNLKIQYSNRVSKQEVDSEFISKIQILQEQLDKVKFQSQQKQRQFISERQQKENLINVLTQKNNAQSQQIVQKEQMIEEKRKNTVAITEMQRLFQQSKWEAQKWAKQKKKLQQQTTDLSKDKKQIEQELLQHKSILSRKEQEINNIQEKLIQIEAEKTNLMRSIIQLKQQMMDKQKQTEQSTEITIEAQNILRKQQMKVLQLTQKNERQTKKANAQDQSITKLTNDLQKAQSNSNSLKRQIDNLNAKINQLKKNTVPIIDFENIIKQSKKQAQKWVADKIKLERQNLAFKKQKVQLTKQKDYLSDQLRSSKAQCSDIENLLKKQKQKIVQQTLELNESNKLKQKLELNVKKLSTELSRVETNLKISQSQCQRLKAKLLEKGFSNKQKIQMQARIQKLKEQKQLQNKQAQIQIQQLQGKKKIICQITEQLQSCSWKLLSANGEIDQLRQGRSKLDKQKTDLTEKIEKYKALIGKMKNATTRKSVFDFINNYISTHPGDKAQLRQQINVYLS